MKNKLSPEEFKHIVLEAVSNTLSEMDGRTHGRVRKKTEITQQNQLNGIPSTNPRKTNLDTILHGIDLDPRATDHFITPYKTKYLFHGKNLREVAALITFDFKHLYELNKENAILKGDIFFNNQPLKGAIVVNLFTKEVTYSYNGNGRRYKLIIDPSKKQLWDKLISELIDSANV